MAASSRKQPRRRAETLLVLGETHLSGELGRSTPYCRFQNAANWARGWLALPPVGCCPLVASGLSPRKNRRSCHDHVMPSLLSELLCVVATKSNAPPPLALVMSDKGARDSAVLMGLPVDAPPAEWPTESFDLAGDLVLRILADGYWDKDLVLLSPWLPLREADTNARLALRAHGWGEDEDFAAAVLDLALSRVAPGRRVTTLLSSELLSARDATARRRLLRSGGRARWSWLWKARSVPLTRSPPNQGTQRSCALKQGIGTAVRQPASLRFTGEIRRTNPPICASSCAHRADAESSATSYENRFLLINRCDSPSTTPRGLGDVTNLRL
jgi:hypothetical protein